MNHSGVGAISHDRNFLGSCWRRRVFCALQGINDPEKVIIILITSPHIIVLVLCENHWLAIIHCLTFARITVVALSACITEQALIQLLEFTDEPLIRLDLSIRILGRTRTTENSCGSGRNSSGRNSSGRNSRSSRRRSSRSNSSSQRIIEYTPFLL